MKQVNGRCLCGAIRFSYSGPENWSGHCHCDSCRRATSSPMTSFVGVPRDKASFSGDEASIYESSPGVRRYFCGTCGSPLAFDADRYPDEIHFYAASFEDPEVYVPEFHCHKDEQLQWLELGDELPVEKQIT